MKKIAIGLMVLFSLNCFALEADNEVILTSEELHSYSLEVSDLLGKIDEIKRKKRFGKILLGVEVAAAVYFIRKAASYTDYSNRGKAIRKFFRVDRALQDSFTKGNRELWMTAAAASAIAAGHTAKYILVDSIEELESLENQLLQIEDDLIEEKNRDEVLKLAEEFDVEL